MPTAVATRAALRPVATTAWPAASAARAMSAPMPRPAPVTSQTFVSVMSLSFGVQEARPPAGACGGATSLEPRERRSSAVWQSPLGGGTGRDPLTAADGPSLVVVDTRQDLREFLASRRARITPQQAGLPTYGGHRRVKGLRREELALLAGVSVEYYTRLERGHARGVSDSVLEALVRALQLDEAERAHLYDLARTANPAHARRRPPQQRVRP